MVVMNLLIYLNTAGIAIIILRRIRLALIESHDALKGEVAERKKAEEEKEELIRRLQDALTQVKTLKGLLPICANCKKVRDDGGYWGQIENYLQSHSEVEFTHGVCPDCAKKLYGEISPNEEVEEP